jgi:hypothetical protein
MSRFVRLDSGRNSASYAAADNIVATFKADRGSSYVVTLAGGSIEVGGGTQYEIMKKLNAQGADLVYVPGRKETGLDYISPRSVVAAFASKADRTGKCELEVWLKGSTRAHATAVKETEAEQWLAGLRRAKPELLEMNDPAYGLTRSAYIDPSPIISMTAAPSFGLSAHGKEGADFSIAGSATEKAGVLSLAADLANRNGQLVKLPSEPLMYVNPDRILSFNFHFASRSDKESRGEIMLSERGFQVAHPSFPSPEDARIAMEILTDPRWKPSTGPR